MLKKCLLGICLFITSLVYAATPVQPIASDEAFVFSAKTKDAQTITAEWRIAPGYYLYRDRFSYKLVSPEGGELGPVTPPLGIPKIDDILGHYQVYKDHVAIDIPLQAIHGDTVTLKVCYQGCSEHNFCYPPETKEVTLNLKDLGGSAVIGNITGNIESKPVSEQDRITQLLSESHLWLTLLTFFGFGLLLSLTPCVLPMIPILSGIILGHGDNMTTRKAFFLSLSYVLSMALTYALLGVLFGLAGDNLQVLLQTPWVLGIFSLLFVGLALSLFGFYELQLPSRWQSMIMSTSMQQRGGNYLGVAIMGVLSTLIVSPCVTAPLVGALAYIGTTGNALLGGSALFALGLGMGIPLLIIGTSHGKFKPPTGPWMNTVKCFFGVMLLGVAVWMLERILPGPITLILWAALCIIPAVYLGILNPARQTPWSHFWKGVGLLLALYGILLVIGAAMGNTNPLQPLAPRLLPGGPTATHAQTPLFQRIKSNDDLDHALASAMSQGRYVMLDFYADWCIACKELEFNTFADPAVRKALGNFVVLQADVTANDVIDKALEERLGVVAPPTILFFSPNGDELKHARIVGEIGPQAFLAHLKQVTE